MLQPGDFSCPRCVVVSLLPWFQDTNSSLREQLEKKKKQYREINHDTFWKKKETNRFSLFLSLCSFDNVKQRARPSNHSAG